MNKDGFPASLLTLSIIYGASSSREEGLSGWNWCGNCGRARPPKACKTANTTIHNAKWRCFQSLEWRAFPPESTSYWNHWRNNVTLFVVDIGCRFWRRFCKWFCNREKKNETNDFHKTNIFLTKCSSSSWIDLKFETVFLFSLDVTDGLALSIDTISWPRRPSSRRRFSRGRVLKHLRTL